MVGKIMALSKQKNFAVRSFEGGMVVHNGDVLTTYPTRPGFHAIFYPSVWVDLETEDGQPHPCLAEQSQD